MKNLIWKREQSKWVRRTADVLAVTLLFVGIFAYSPDICLAKKVTVTFVNNTGQEVDDLHIEIRDRRPSNQKFIAFPNPPDPFTNSADSNRRVPYDGGYTSSVSYWGGTVPRNGSVTLTFHTKGDNSRLIWHWTLGGTVTSTGRYRNGEQIGPTHTVDLSNLTDGSRIRTVGTDTVIAILPAGTVIPNVGEVTCAGLGTVTSNIANVTVEPVYGTRLIAMDEGTTTVNVGETASSTVALVNTGNATSTYTLKTSGEDVALKDANDTPLAGPVTLGAGEIFPITLEVIPQSRGTMALGLSATANVPDDGWGDPESVEYLTHLKVTAPDISITKEVNVASARPGDEVTYTLTVTNNGDGVAHDVVITDKLSEYVEYVSASCENGTVTYDEETRTVSVIGDIPPEKNLILKITIVITCQDPANAPETPREWISEKSKDLLTASVLTENTVVKKRSP